MIRLLLASLVPMVKHTIAKHTLYTVLKIKTFFIVFTEKKYSKNKSLTRDLRLIDCLPIQRLDDYIYASNFIQ